MRKSSAPSYKRNLEPTVSASASLEAIQTAEIDGSSGKLHNFNVQYAEASTRKHKKYTDDGILETQDLKAVLKDKYGRVSSASLKSAGC